MRNARTIFSGLGALIHSPGRYIYDKLHKRYRPARRFNTEPGADEGDIRQDKYYQRLEKEWAEHGKIIIGIDVDDTTLPFRTATQAECDKVIELLKDCQRVGAYIVIYSCRDEAGLEGAKGYLSAKGLEVDAVNKNPIKLPYGNSAKPYANIFLDDRAGLKLALKMLEEAMYRQRARKYGESHNYPGWSGF